ncbi:MAG: hypothetical protein IPM29_08470 [Planctomycetes bacterium]|nr:hypothetical protein [Planctomycetota bacterium]
MGKRTFECPQCGAEVPEGRLACPECGSDDRTGWQDADELDYASVEIPDFYEDPASARGRGPSRLVVAALLALLAMLIWVLSR